MTKSRQRDALAGLFFYRCDTLIQLEQSPNRFIECVAFIEGVGLLPVALQSEVTTVENVAVVGVNLAAGFKRGVV
jgi:hypothetical protein